MEHFLSFTTKDEAPTRLSRDTSSASAIFAATSTEGVICHTRRKRRLHHRIKKVKKTAACMLRSFTITHYDDYANLPSWSSAYEFVSEYTATDKNASVKGQVVATQTRILGTTNFLRTVLYYDDKYRLIQSTADNVAGAKDRTTNLLSFDGKTTAGYQSHVRHNLMAMLKLWLSHIILKFAAGPNNYTGSEISANKDTDVI